MLNILQGFKYLHITKDVQVKSGPGVVHTVTITAPATTAGYITLYDSLTEEGTVIAKLYINTDVAQSSLQMPVSLILDAKFKTGLYVGYDGTIVAATVTVTYF